MGGNLKKLLSALVLVALLGGGYFFVSSTDLLKPPGERLNDIETQVATLERDIGAALADIQNVRFDGALFQREDFRSLRDISQVLTPPPVSRTDPFAGI